MNFNYHSSPFGHVDYFLVLRKKDFKTLCKQMDISVDNWVSEGANATSHTFTHKDGRIVCAVCVNCNKVEDAQLFPLLVHEAVHVWQEVRDAMGEIHPSSEFEAYSIQCITQDLYNDYISTK